MKKNILLMLGFVLAILCFSPDFVSVDEREDKFSNVGILGEGLGVMRFFG